MSNILAAVSLITDLAQAAARLTQQAAAVSAAVSRAQMEGRDLTDAEWTEIIAADDKARMDLEAVIAAKKGL